MRKQTIVLILTLMGLCLLILLPRVIGLDQFVSVDEPDWLKYSGNFYYALRHFDFANTVDGEDVVVMWIITAAMLWYFPAYRGLGQGYFNDGFKFDNFLLEYNKLSLELLKRSRLIQVVVIAASLLLAFYLLRKLFGNRLALVATLFVAFDPYFLGHSRLLNHEGMLSLFMLLSGLGMIIYLYKDSHPFFLILSAVSAGLAQLTKSSALAILPLVILLLSDKVVAEWRASKRLPLGAIKYSIKTLLLWLTIIVLVFFVIWPGMWVAPGKMLFAVYGDAISNAFQGQPLVATKVLDPNQFGLDWNGSPSFVYGMLWRTTPLLWLGVILAGLSFLARDGSARPNLKKYVISYLGFVALLFIFMFGVARGRNSPHYIISSYVSLDVVAGMGLVFGIDWLGSKFHTVNRQSIKNTILVTVLLLQGISAFPYYPYYYTYHNPIMATLEGGNKVFEGYGEGLELAGRYLAQKPDAQDLTIMAWYSQGVFSYFFPGKNKYLNITQIVDEGMINDIRSSDYLVIYYAHQKSRNIPAKLLAALEAIPPEHVIWLNGIEYVRIYRVSDFPDSFYTALGQ
jgi:hypothetical protein